MVTPVIIPRLGNTVESCIIGSWGKKEGEKIKKGDTLLEIETDKTTFEVEAPADGILLGAFFKEGDIVPVLANIAVIGDKGEEFESYRPKPEEAKKELSEQPVKEKDEEEKEIPRVEKETTVDQQAVREEDWTSGGISPRAKQFAMAHNVNLDKIAGSGPHGRTLERDVIKYFHTTPRSSSLAGKLLNEGWTHKNTYSGIGGMIIRKDLRQPGKKLSTIRTTIAKHMHSSLMGTAQYTITISARADAILSLRKKIKGMTVEHLLPDITINDMVMYAVIYTLVSYPEFNAEFIDGKVYQYEDINLAFACDTPRGLMVPVIRSAQKLSLRELSLAVEKLSNEAISGNIAPDDLTGGTITTTNIGSMGIEYFTPILNTPQVAVLGICNIDLKPVKIGKDVQFIEHIKLCLTVDHQVIDGALAARFLRALKDNIENFINIAGLNI
ncbi:Dihydrolipoyllysine-residue acetyltransferase component of pyruvate dehydrogenase complex [subsurface metagenome]|nr:2-oxo acid dehydrogenase subunit E2 [Clostridia bacterium]